MTCHGMDARLARRDLTEKLRAILVELLRGFGVGVNSRRNGSLVQGCQVSRAREPGESYSSYGVVIAACPVWCNIVSRQ